MNTYNFLMNGVVCFSVKASSRKEAVEKVKALAPETGPRKGVIEVNKLSVEIEDVEINIRGLSVDNLDFAEDEDGFDLSYETTCPSCDSRDSLFVVEANGCSMHS